MSVLMLINPLEGEERLQQIKKTIPLGRLANKEEVASAVVFLAMNNYANNCILNLDGGLSAVSPLLNVDSETAQP
jgi:NAD(P)-dependent dehydrogenase (short-subunit alcohol dehydrogenase family)